MKLEEFLPYILLEVPGCSQPLATQTLLSVAHDFCQATLCWSEYQDPISLIDNQRDYDLEFPTGSAPVSVKAVQMGSRRLRPVTMTELQLVLPNWQAATSSEPAYYNSAISHGVLSLYPMPLDATSNPVVMRISYMPNRKAVALPDFLGDEYLTPITAGTKSRLMAMPGQPWSNPALSGFYKTVYDEGVFTAKAAEVHEQTPGTVLVPPRAFGF